MVFCTQIVKVSTYGGVLKFVTKMALYRPKRVVSGTYSFTKFDAGLIF